MKLRSLRIFGFKTFADQTTLAFEPGVTGIVGPNGSGKSNLVDAIRWVLGEQSAKSLRSGKTEDVIFAGNERRKPLGMAEVSITFANDEGKMRVDAAEVQLTRRAYRAGESEFFINRQQVRLRDIIDVLMGTGLGPGSYAIVSQGQIDAILSSRPTERRSLFEETAGVNRFIARKDESLRRLEQTEQNGIRISDLLAEIGVRFPELEAQARRARRFRKASGRLRDLEILTYVRQSSSRREERERLQTQLARCEAECAAAVGKVAALNADVSTLRAKVYAHDMEFEKAREAQTALRAQLAEHEARHAAATARHEMLDAQVSQAAQAEERAAADRAELEAAIVRLERELEPQTSALQALREREGEARERLTEMRAELDRAFAEVRAFDARAAGLAASAATRRAQEQAARKELERLEREVGELRTSAQEKREAFAERASAREAAQRELEKLEAQLAEAETNVAQAQMRAEASSRRTSELQEALRRASGELLAAEARLHTLEELEANLEGHVPGTRAVLEAQARGELSGIHGVVSQLIHVEQEHARALDIAFGGSLSNVVTATSEDAKHAIAYLSKRELGRATFLPLDTLGGRTGRNPSSAPRGEGVIGYAHALVRAEPQYKGIVAFLVGSVLVVSSLDVGVRLVRQERFGDSVVTLDGEEIRGGGAMSGGRYKRERALLSRAAQVRALRERVPTLQQSLAALEAEAAVAKEQGATAARERDETRRSIGELTGALREARTRVASVEQDRVRLEREAEGMRGRADEREKEASAVRLRLAALELPESDESAVHQRREDFDAALEQARENVARAETVERAIAAEISTLREALAAATAQRDGARSRLTKLERDRERAAADHEAMSAEILALRGKMLESEKALDEMKPRVREAEAASEGARRERERLIEQANELDSSLRMAQLEEREAVQVGEKARLRLAEVDAELGMLSAQFAQQPATAEECAEIEARYADETEDFTAEIVRLREETARLQNVNLNAEAEIEELTERKRFLEEQLDDLMRAKETLLAGIAEIEEQSHRQFNETFEKVRATFSEVYARMFPGGQAKMWLTDATKLSEVGVELSVQPPGKKMMTLALLSGGERAMTSAALIFALIAVKPSPFYLLDEVDAALDDANVERFSKTAREMAKDAQMLVVTHNKQTMEMADRLYGVTMSEPGISRIISATLADAQSQNQEKEERVPIPA